MDPLVSSASTAALLSISDASKIFGGFRAVDSVSLRVDEGEVLGIAGPNGAGKSTLFNLVSGVPFGPDAGSIHFDNQRIDRIPAHAIGRLGLRRTFQAEQLFATLSVRDNVLVSAKYLGSGSRSAADTDEALERVGLTGHSRALASNIPLLAKKKLMIASALVAKPRLLMLDEPAGGLNTDDQAELVSLLRELQGQGLTLIIIEHVLSVLRQLANRMIILSSGRLLAEGAPDEVLADPLVLEAYLGKAPAA
jgi:branched-chain amino acid transport system ATP-binding protein